jgi:pimeloyl-ACP methyl ester carboxylesterase
MHRVPSRLRAGLALTTAALSFSPARAIAQGTLDYNRTTFLHGIGSSDVIWKTPWPELSGQTTPQYLSRQFALGGVAFPDLNEGAPTDQYGLRYDGQRANLLRLVTATGGRHVIVSHSLGALSARGVQEQRPDLVGGIITVAAPHQGVSIADSVMGSNAVAYVKQIDIALQQVTVSARASAVFLATIGAMKWAIDAFMASKHPQTFPTAGVEDLARLEALKDLRYTSPAIIAHNAYRGDAGIPRANVVGRIPMEHAILRLAAGRQGSPSFADSSE